MIGKHYKYLTNSYVEAMGMEKFPVDRGNFEVWIGDALYPTTMRGFDVCVAYNHALYVREPDGLAWSV